MPLMPLEDRFQLRIETLDSRVDPDSVARVIDVFVDQLDLKELGFQNIEISQEGRPKYPASALLKLLIYGIVNGIRSSRQLARSCHINLEVIWLLQGLTPNFRTISEFRRINIDRMKSVFHQCNRSFSSASGSSFYSVDGSKFLACNGKDNTFNGPKLEDRIRRLDQRMDTLLEEMEETDRREEEEETTVEDKEDDEESSSSSNTNEWDQLVKRKEKYLDLKEQLQTSGDTQISTTDPDAKLMRHRSGHEVCFNVQTAVNSETHLIENYYVTNQVNDLGLLWDTLSSLKEEICPGILDSVADKGYQSSEDMIRCFEQGIIPHVIPQEGKKSYLLTFPYEEHPLQAGDLRSTSAETLKKVLRSGHIPEAYRHVLSDLQIITKREYIREQTAPVRSPFDTPEEMKQAAKEGYLVRDVDHNVVYCPGGETLYFRGKRKAGDVIFGNPTACRRCDKRHYCVRGKKDFKEVSFYPGTPVKPVKGLCKDETNRYKVPRKRRGHYETNSYVTVTFTPEKEKMNRRFSISEHPFGTMKRAMGLHYYLLRGLQKIEGETALFCLGYNLKRLMNIQGAKKMIEMMT